jgi:hypothetical protein
MGIMAGIGGLVGGLSGLFGGGSNQPTGPAPWLMPDMGGAANNAFSGISGLSGYGNAAQGTGGAAQNTFQNLYNNPYAGGYQGGANFAGGLGQNAALGAYGTGGALTGAGLSTIPMAGQLFQSGFDPQQALYGRTQQQVQDQTGATLAASGIGNTPYGAGIAAQTNANFNIDWQNNQLQRQLAGAQGAGGLLTQGGNLANLGTGIQNTAPGQFLGASAMPYGAYGQIGGDQNQALGSYLGNIGGAQGISNVGIQDWLNYVQAGNQAGGVANQAYANELKANQQQFGQQMQFGQMLGGGLYGLGQTPFGKQYGMGNWFGGGGGGGGNAFWPSSSFMSGGMSWG